MVGLADTGYYDCGIWHCLDVPGFGLGGFLGHYWTTDAGIDRWNAGLFQSQAATMTELTGLLMTADLSTIQSEGLKDSFLKRTSLAKQVKAADLE